MKEALVNDALIAAHPSAPSVASCPQCGHPVDLRRREGTWFWRHQRGAPLSCPARPNIIGRGETIIANVTGQEPLQGR
jgi:hypothetical protein